jgi:biotin transporter BioY
MAATAASAMLAFCASRLVERKEARVSIALWLLIGLLYLPVIPPTRGAAVGARDVSTLAP